MDWDVVHVYTRQQALDDGELIDVSDLAVEAGFTWPVAVTSRLYYQYIEPTSELDALGQSAAGRLWDVFSVLRWKATSSNETTVHFQVWFLTGINHRRKISLKAVAGPGDSGEPVITIMLREED